MQCQVHIQSNQEGALKVTLHHFLLEAYTHEMLFIIAGPEFEELTGFYPKFKNPSGLVLM